MAHSPIPRLLLVMARIWSMPLWWATNRSANRSDIGADIARWVECVSNPNLVPLSERDRFAYFAGALPEFRSLIHIRTTDLSPLIRLPLRRIYKGLPGLVIDAGSIGPGLFIHHGLGTIVIARSIGANFWVNQHVSLGYSRRGIPEIGDNVTVASGAVVVGPISLGDGCTVGGNAVITKDVAPGVTMVAAPAVELARPESTRRSGLGEGR